MLVAAALMLRVFTEIDAHINLYVILKLNFSVTK